MVLWAGQNPAHVQYKRHAHSVGEPGESNPPSATDATCQDRAHIPSLAPRYGTRILNILFLNPEGF
jgi:hypothetical protein